MDGRKIYFNDWLDVLIDSIEQNTDNHHLLKEYTKETEKCEKRILENKKLIEKINKYKKTDSDGNTYLFLFPNELEEIMWIFLENKICRI